MSCSVFLRINYELKMVVMLVAVVIYNVVILQTRSSLLDQFSYEPYPTDASERYQPSRFLAVYAALETASEQTRGEEDC